MGGSWACGASGAGAGWEPANLREPGGGREGRSGARQGTGKAGAGGRGGAAGPGRFEPPRRACAGPRGCASRTETPSGVNSPLPGTVMVRTWPCGGDCDASARGGATRRRGGGQADWGWEPAGGGREGGSGGERRHLAWRPASLRGARRGRWGRWKKRANVDQRPSREEEAGGRCQLRDRSRWRSQCCALGGLRPGEPQVLTRMQRGWRLARDDERRGDVGKEEMASLGLPCLRTSCGACGLRDLLARAARGSLWNELLGGLGLLQWKRTPMIVKCLGAELTSSKRQACVRLFGVEFYSKVQ